MKKALDINTVTTETTDGSPGASRGAAGTEGQGDRSPVQAAEHGDDLFVGQPLQRLTVQLRDLVTCSKRRTVWVSLDVH